MNKLLAPYSTVMGTKMLASLGENWWKFSRWPGTLNLNFFTLTFTYIKYVIISSKLLSKQQHYDWGLRALKTVLNGCNNSMKEYRKMKQQPGVTLLDVELNLAVKALKMDTLSKLTYKDHEKFKWLLNDVFPELEPVEIEQGPLRSALEKSVDELGLKYNKRQVHL